ncbi:MAG TPA: AI-2E family transporter [Candidatus Latescibacteria bacterium]|nr:AI-2E family transporter [Candidatus Latescibacterota bacterium]
MNQQIKIIIGLLVAVAVLWITYQIRGVLAPFGLAFVLAYVLAPIVDRMEGRGLERTWSILLVFVMAFTGLGFGAFKVGDKLTGEMVELSDGFMRREKIDKSFVIRNNRESPLVVENMAWEDVSETQPFALLNIKDLPFEIESGGQTEVQIRFAPQSHEASENVLSVLYGQNENVYRVRVYGNRANDNINIGRGSESAGEMEALPVVFSHSGIGFGSAGPNIVTKVSAKASEFNTFLQDILGVDFNLPALVKEHGERLTQTMLGGTTVFIGGVVSGLTFVVIVPFVAFFYLKEGRRRTRTLIELVPNAYFELCLNLLHQINGQIGGYIRGQILATSVVSILAIGGLTLIEVEHALPLGLLAGLANMIPFLGPLIGFFAASIAALAAGGGLGVVAEILVVFLIIQMIDNVVIQPTVVAKSVEMHPLVILFVVMVGSQLMGIVGMLIAVPLTGILKVSSQTVYEGVRGYRLE